MKFHEKTCALKAVKSDSSLRTHAKEKYTSMNENISEKRKSFFPKKDSNLVKKSVNESKIMEYDSALSDEYGNSCKTGLGLSYTQHDKIITQQKFLRDKLVENGVVCNSPKLPPRKRVAANIKDNTEDESDENMTVTTEQLIHNKSGKKKDKVRPLPVIHPKDASKYLANKIEQTNETSYIL